MRGRIKGFQAGHGALMGSLVPCPPLSLRTCRRRQVVVRLGESRLFLLQPRSTRDNPSESLSGVNWLSCIARRFTRMTPYVKI